ncbi:MAG: CooT family nickel-binding protein [Desulfurococcales archaeon]|nr:CooT family nickel-binding protein [Desulfurococcales archaeon]
MCESKAILKKDGSEEPIMDDVALLEMTDRGILLIDIKGERKLLENHVIDYIDFIKHKIYLKQV